MENDRSPLKAKPLRNPGQSIREERFDLLYDKLLGPMMVALLLTTWALLEWWRYYFPTRPNPWLTTAIAVFAVGYSIYLFRKFWPRIMALKLAEEGEKAVGQYLDGLRESGYVVFHDLVGEGFNVDHVVVGPAGAFTVETKTWKKPRQGSPEICFDGEKLTVQGRSPDRDPVVQAKAQANWLKNLISESTGRAIYVRPVVLFPGWFIKAENGARREVWVLEPKALPAFLAKEKVMLSNEDTRLIAFHLSRYVREQEKVLEKQK